MVWIRSLLSVSWEAKENAEEKDAVDAVDETQDLLEDTLQGQSIARDVSKFPCEDAIQDPVVQEDLRVEARRFDIGDAFVSSADFHFLELVLLCLIGSCACQHQNNFGPNASERKGQLQQQT